VLPSAGATALSEPLWLPPASKLTMSPPIPEITSPEYGEFLKEATDRVRDPD
jgi:hypothetical protein